MPHCPLVLATDASLTGWGIAASEVCVHQVASICRTSERSRFKLLPNGSARASALSQAGLYDLLQAVDKGNEWVIDKKFAEIPSSILYYSKCSVCGSGIFVHQEDIGILEARAMVKSLEQFLYYPGYYGHRLLMLGDNLGVVLSFARSRARNFEILLQKQMISMHCDYRYFDNCCKFDFIR